MSRPIAALGASVVLLAAVFVACAAPARGPAPLAERPIDAGEVVLDAGAAIEPAPSDAAPPDAAPLVCHAHCKPDVIDDRPCGRWEQLGPRSPCTGRPCPPSRPPRWIECDPRCCDASR